VSRYRSYLPVGSQIAIAHATSEDRPAEAVQKMTDVYKKASAPFNFRTRKQILALFDGLSLLDPGLVPCPDWRRDPNTKASPSAGWNLAGVGALPAIQLSGRVSPPVLRWHRHGGGQWGYGVDQHRSRGPAAGVRRAARPHRR
jgi:hypothetical protein